jgi:hypothetical protein
LILVKNHRGWFRGGQRTTPLLQQVLKSETPRRTASAASKPALVLETARPRRAQLFMAGATCILGLGLTAAMHRSEWVRPGLLSMTGPASPKRPMPLRRWDPTCRLRGWRHLAAAVDDIRFQLRRNGIEPVLATGRWNLPGELAFYCREQPVVYCLGAALGERQSQYDFWRPNPLADAGGFAGKTFIMVDCPAAGIAEAFDHLEAAQNVVYQEDGQPIARWTVVIGRGYRGFAASKQSSHF